MKIAPKHVVALTYELHTINEDGDQTFVERADEQNPLVFLAGTGMMLPKFEENLAGLVAGEDYAFELLAHDAYGDINPQAFVNLPHDIFNEVEMPKVGDIIPLSDNQGNQFRALVNGVNETTVDVDLNHPMAGKNLHFAGKVLAVREATEEELSHGHAHGVDGSAGH